jgi:carbamoyltransferase
MSTTILGLNAYHGDASAAIVRDGQLLAAVEEERFNRVKHWAGFPKNSIRFCLDTAGVSMRDVDHISVSSDPKANIAKRIGFVLIKRPSFQAVWERLKRQTKVAALKPQLAEAGGCTVSDVRAQIHYIEHHLTHLASGFFISPFEEAAILSIDGMGDFVSTMTGTGEGTSWEVMDRIFYPHSVGFLYNVLTLYLGFPNYGDEYKVMGLAPYGEPEYLDLFRQMIYPKGDGFELNLDYFTHHKDGILMAWDNGAPKVEPFHSKLLEKTLGPQRKPTDELTKKHENIARSLQAVTEEIILHLLQRLYDRTKKKNLCLVGGVAMNSVANGKVTLNTPFENVYIPAGAADNGTAMGGAFYVWNKVLGQPRSFLLDHAYWGDAADDRAIEAAIAEAGVPHYRLADDELVKRTADALCDGKIVGWFQGRMELGARALGNRSLLADPRRADMREIINLKIKFREKFRPFAPSIQEEHVHEFFEVDETSPFMERVLQIRPEKRSLIPAVTHVDGSGRLQSVSRRTNPLYWNLIEAFRKKTGVPIILNTSLNENEPIVRTPAEAISCFLRTAMDQIVVGNYVIDREHPQFPQGEAYQGALNQMAENGART